MDIDAEVVVTDLDGIDVGVELRAIREARGWAGRLEQGATARVSALAATWRAGGSRSGA